MAPPRFAGGREFHLIWKVDSNKQPRTADKEWSSRLSFGEGLTIPHRKKIRREILHKSSNLEGFYERDSESSVSIRGGEFFA
jgi:hypothetical protein